MTAVQFLSLFASTLRGLTFLNIIPKTDELGQVQNTTVANKTFNTRPSMAAHVDSKHALFQLRDRCKKLPNVSFQINILRTRSDGKLKLLKA